MWSYYGSKSKVVDLYPKPMYPKIIEPFAGSARYALKWFDRDVLLVDRYDVVIRLWKFLQRCSPKDILGLPTLKYGESLNDFKMSEDERLLMGFMVSGGVASPRVTVQEFMRHKMMSEKKRIADNLHKIKHWEFVCADYTWIKNQTATWFIDPPYQFGGDHYKVSNKDLDYKALADWSRYRAGQVIVCENTKASWMEFYPMAKMKGAYDKTTEAIWSNYPTGYEVDQGTLL